MNSIRDCMTGDHRRCDDLFVVVEQSLNQGGAGVAGNKFDDFCRATLAHFQAEEDFLFPAFEEKTGMRMGPTQMMRLEHQQMRALMEEGRQALAGGDDEGYGGAAETLLILMQQHNMKEENVLYPMCDEHLDDLATDLLAQLQEAIGSQRS